MLTAYEGWVLGRPISKSGVKAEEFPEPATSMIKLSGEANLGGSSKQSGA